MGHNLSCLSSEPFSLCVFLWSEGRAANLYLLLSHGPRHGAADTNLTNKLFLGTTFPPARFNSPEQDWVTGKLNAHKEKGSGMAQLFPWISSAFLCFRSGDFIGEFPCAVPEASTRKTRQGPGHRRKGSIFPIQPLPGTSTIKHVSTLRW